MDAVTLTKKRKRHKIKELFSTKKLDQRIAKKEFKEQGGEGKRFDYILYTGMAKLSTEEEIFFQKFFAVTSVYINYRSK